MKKLLKILTIIILIFSIFACSKKEEVQDDVLTVKDLNISQHNDTGGIYLEVTIEEFNNLGFSYGDSVDISFSNGYLLEDIPYYSENFLISDYPFLMGKEGNDYIEVCDAHQSNMWNLASVNKGDATTIKLNSKHKYLQTQIVYNINYEDERELFESDEVFANFRSINTSNIKENIIYRSASPIDNIRNRATYVDALIKEAGINFVLNLSNSDNEIQALIYTKDFNSPYYASLFENKNVLSIPISLDYTDNDTKTKIADALIEMLEHDGPYLIHDLEGKDRTGFVCMLLEALMGASYDEIVNDYMTTYDNYYYINQTQDNFRYKTIVEDLLNPMISDLVKGCTDIKKADLSNLAYRYLLQAGMTSGQIDALKEKLMR